MNSMNLIKAHSNWAQGKKIFTILNGGKRYFFIYSFNGKVFVNTTLNYDNLSELPMNLALKYKWYVSE